MTDRARRLFVCSDEKPRCPHGHRLNAMHMLTEDGVIRCGHTDPQSKLKCGTLIYVALVTKGGSAQVRGTGERLWLIAELTAAEASLFSTHPMLVLERFQRLGHTTPGVDLDLKGADDDAA